MLQVSEVTGQVGDRQLILTKCSVAENCLPVLDIRSTDAKTQYAAILYDMFGAPYDRIVYKEAIN